MDKCIIDLYDLNSESSGIFVQIGAGAGNLDKRAKFRDGFTEFIKSMPRQKLKKIVLVEPNPLNLPLLKECWKGYHESYIYDVGIVPKMYNSNILELYYCPLDAPHYQVASVKKSHVQHHYGEDCEIHKFDIPVTTIEQFIHDVIGTEKIELLALDIEGVDAEILLELDLQSLNVKYLSFEHVHLCENKETVFHHLENNGFEFIGLGVDHNGCDCLFLNKRFC